MICRRQHRAQRVPEDRSSDARAPGVVENPVEGVRRLARGVLGSRVERIGFSAAIGFLADVVGVEEGGGGENGGGRERENVSPRGRLRSNRREVVAVTVDWCNLRILYAFLC